jgi:hypothetical protein
MPQDKHFLLLGSPGGVHVGHIIIQLATALKGALNEDEQPVTGQSNLE